MKRTCLSILFLIFSLMVILSYSCLPKKVCCNLPAATNLKATPNPYPNELDWDPVQGAIAYKVTIRNLSNNTIFLTQIVTENSFQLPQGMPTVTYFAVVEAICDLTPECVSPNSVSLTFTIPPIMVIVQDIVVMREHEDNGTGLEDCNVCGSQFIAWDNGSQINLTPFMPQQGTTNRSVFLFKVTYEGEQKLFKMAFEGSCQKKMKILDCSPSKINLTINSDGQIEFNNALGELFLVLSPNRDGKINGEWKWNFDASTDFVEFLQCSGSWNQYCVQSP